jgi:erythronate-4-phosphate dehydrogenase
MIRIVADHKIPFLKGAFEGVARVEYLPGGEISRRDLVDADALITRTRTRCERSLLEGTGVRFIASATIGYDHIDTAYCMEAGIEWANAPGCNAASVQQYMVSTLLCLATRNGIGLKGLTLGVVGVGHVGGRVARAAEALGMKVLLNDPPRARKEGEEAFTGLDELLGLSDVVTLHVPLNRGGEDNTYRLVDNRFIDKLRPGAVLVNTSRGGVADEQALLGGINRGKLSDVVLDVFDREPDIHPDLLNRLTLATPHIAGYSLDGKANGTGMAVRAVSRAFQLGMDDWHPDQIPCPDQLVLFSDAAALPREQMLWELYRMTYDVSVDDGRLRADPGAFESLREDYPLRREPDVYTVRLSRGTRDVREILETLGFSVLSDHYD